MNFILVFLWILVQLEPSMLIIYGRGQSTTTTQYLNTGRPLWILEDEVRKHDEIQSYSTTPTSLQLSSRTPIPIVAPPVPPSLTFLVRTSSVVSPSASTLIRPQSLRLSQLPLKPIPRRIRLPSHYVNTRKSMEQQGKSNVTIMHWRRRHVAQRAVPSERGQKSDASMPIFDNAPGQDNEKQSHPVFFYNGPRGELIVNTMLSTQRYPMHEPVPGQVLYPPLTPMFRPKPIVERIRLPNRSEFLNLTLIPFYAHEAINGPTFSDGNQWSKTMTTTMPTLTTVTTTTPTPPVLYETQLKKSSYRQHQKQHERHRQQYKRQRKLKKAKSKHYTAYHSPDDVQWQPPVVEVLQFKRDDAYIPTNTAPLLMQTPPSNHRHFSPAAVATSISSAPIQPVSFNNNVEPPYESVDEATINIIDPLLSNAYDNNDDDEDDEDIVAEATGYGNRHVEADVDGFGNDDGNRYVEVDVDAIRKGKRNRHLDIDIDGNIRINTDVAFEQNFPIIYFGESNEELVPIKDTSTDDSSTTEDYVLSSLPLTTTHLNSSTTLSSLPAQTSSMKTTTPNNGTSPEQVEPRLSSRYALTKEYYAFPVYTLGKLLHSTTTTTEKTPTTILSPNLAKSTTSNASTWFILNSRYKGRPYKDQSYPLNNKTDLHKYYTSKYIANSSSHGELTQPKPKAIQK